MPYLKPRFVVADSGLVPVPMPPCSAYADLLGAGKMLDELAHSDEYFAEFSAYQRYGHPPVSHGLWTMFRRGRSAWAAARGERHRHAALALELRKAGFFVVDGRDALIGSDRPVRELYHEDSVHLSRDGNGGLAASLSEVIRTLLQERSAPP